MSLCPICGKGMCDHTPNQRGQTREQTYAPLTEKDMRVIELANKELLAQIERKTQK